MDDLHKLAKKEQKELKRILEEEEEIPQKRTWQEYEKDNSYTNTKKKLADIKDSISNWKNQKVQGVKDWRQEKVDALKATRVGQATGNIVGSAKSIKEDITAKREERLAAEAKAKAEKENLAAKREERLAAEATVEAEKEIAKANSNNQSNNNSQPKVTKLQTINSRNIFQSIGSFFLAIIIFGSIMFGGYTANAGVCDTIEDRTIQGYERIFKSYSDIEFTNCVITNSLGSLGEVVKALDITDHIMRFINQQVYRATGDYWYAVVDENAIPMGVFIENIDARDTYNTHESISISATLRVETVDQQIQGIASGFINGLPCSTITPENGTFNLDRSQKRTIVCRYNPNTFSRSENTRFILRTMYDFTTFAYMTPMFIKSTAWDNRTEQQKAQIDRMASDNFLKTQNAPVWIAGNIDGERGKRRIEIDDQTTHANDIVMGITLHADKQTHGWDSGGVNEIKDLVFIFHKSLSLIPDNYTEPGDEFIACGGYTFRRDNEICNEIEKKAELYITSETENKETICSPDDNVYSFDRSGDNKKFRSFSTFETISCNLRADINELFKTNEGDLGFNFIPIKIYTSYNYEVSRATRINIVHRRQTMQQGIRTYTCIGRIEEDAKKGEKSDNKDIYAEKYQTMIRNNLPQVADMEKIRYEAMVAAIIEKYNNFEINPQTDTDNNGVIDFLTGCNRASNWPNDNLQDIRCLVGRLEHHMRLNRNNVEETIKSYYEEYDEIYTEEQQATIEIYYNWLNTLCNIPKPETITTASPTVENNNNNNLKDIGTQCTENNECKTGACAIAESGSGLCLECHPEQNPCDEDMICDEGYCKKNV
ncbi:MAG: hypothetical protein ACMXYG_01590 [Candidatus Woesearchaeota archaeon]